MRTAALIGSACLLVFAAGCTRSDSARDRTRHISYWEKWTGFEADAVERAVQAFNALERTHAQRDPSYRPIEVEHLSVSRIEQKLLVATAGGNPPDIAGLYSYLVPAYADKGALVDLTARLARAGIERDDYVPHVFDLGVHRGRIWALPSTPAAAALHWNKRLFVEAGLDPNTPPSTIEELDTFAEKLTRWEVTEPGGATRIETGYLPGVPAAQKRLLQVGFLPVGPWPWAWGYFFGGELLQGDEHITAASPANARAYAWAASYSKKLGVASMRRFRSGFGNFSSPQNAFLSGKLAMELQGVWMSHFIDKYAPGMQWGAAPFPTPRDHPELARTADAESDVLVIPKDSAHPDEAFEFIRYLSSAPVLEKLCLDQQKFTPLARVSESFWAAHPNPYIRLFRQLSESPNAFAAPRTAIWNEYLRELQNANDAIQNLALSPEQALLGVETRMQAALDRDLASTRRRASQ